MRLNFKQINKGQSLCVVDNTGGAYLPIAQKMCDCFDKVYYHSTYKNPFPHLAMESIGTGYPKLESTMKFWSRLDDFDIILFPDIYREDEGAGLRKMGKMVWGGTPAEQLETNRRLFKQELESVGLYNLPTQYIKGVSNLEKFLKEDKDSWVKLSYYRGETETFHHKNFNVSNNKIESLERSLGPLGDEMEFIVERNMDSISELGYDGFTVNGQMATKNIFGFEIKNCGYVGTYCDYSKLPAPIKVVNDKFNPILQKYGHTGFYSNEIRYTQEGKSYYIDPCMRAGSPPSNTMMEMITNWDEIIPAACRGEVVDPKFKAKYGVELILKSPDTSKGFLPVNFPEEFRQNIKLKGAFNRKGKDYIVPFSYAGFEMVEFGSVVVVGDNLQQIMKQAMEIADQVDAPEVDYDHEAMNKAMKQIQNLKNNLDFDF